MRIACVSNLNQMQFTIARYLERIGHDVTLFLIREYKHFLPEMDCYVINDNIRIENLDWDSENVASIEPKTIRDKFSNFDFIIGSEWTPAFLMKGGIRLDVYIPIGTDLIDYPFHFQQKIICTSWEWNVKYRALLQKRGIQKSSATFVNQNGDMNLEKAFIKLKYSGKRFYRSLPTLFLDDFRNSKRNQDSEYLQLENTIIQLKKKRDCLFISSNRVVYQTNNVHNKGTDKLLKGVAKFYNKYGPIFYLVMFEYGTDVEAAKNLIKELGIDSCVIWMPLVPRKYLWPVLKHFDLGFGNLIQPSYLSNVSMELCSAGVPVIQFGAPTAKMLANIPVLPYLQVTNDSEIYNILELNYLNSNIFDSLRLFSQEWYENNVIETPINDLNGLIYKNGKIRLRIADQLYLYFLKVYALFNRFISKIYMIYKFKIAKNIDY
jgi:hypothetical protein